MNSLSSFELHNLEITSLTNNNKKDKPRTKLALTILSLLLICYGSYKLRAATPSTPSKVPAIHKKGRRFSSHLRSQLRLHRIDHKADDGSNAFFLNVFPATFADDDEYPSLQDYSKDDSWTLYINEDPELTSVDHHDEHDEVIKAFVVEKDEQLAAIKHMETLEVCYSGNAFKNCPVKKEEPQCVVVDFSEYHDETAVQKGWFADLILFADSNCEFAAELEASHPQEEQHGAHHDPHHPPSNK